MVVGPGRKAWSSRKRCPARITPDQRGQRGPIMRQRDPRRHRLAFAADRAGAVNERARLPAIDARIGRDNRCKIDETVRDVDQQQAVRRLWW